MGTRCLHTDAVPNVVCLGKCGARLHAGCALASRCESCYDQSRADSVAPVHKRHRTASATPAAQRRMRRVSEGGTPITHFLVSRSAVADGGGGGGGGGRSRSLMSMWDRSAAMAPAPAPTAAAAAAGSGGGGMRADGAGSGAGSADADVGKAKKKRRQRSLALEQRKEVAMFAWRKGVDKACNHPKFMALGLKKVKSPGRCLTAL